MLRWLTLCLFAVLPALAGAQQELEIITLRHRPLEQVLPALQPLLEAGGTLSGMNDQLILRASRRNREQIRQALAAIDTPRRRLLIRVSQNRQAASVTAQGYAGRGTQAIGSTQTVQVVEGGRALILVGQSLPVPLRQSVFGPGGVTVSETIVFRDLGQGFYAAPQLAGDRVTVDISPQFDSPATAGYGSSDTQRLSTTVSGRIGEWLELGGSSQHSDLGQSGSVYRGSRRSGDQRSVWLQVEELP
jgi:type II secretory pathway component GspD/PulD (secretin)